MRIDVCEENENKRSNIVKNNKNERKYTQKASSQYAVDDSNTEYIGLKAFSTQTNTHACVPHFFY
jgi:hypothetical protein